MGEGGGGKGMGGGGEKGRKGRAVGRAGPGVLVFHVDEACAAKESARPPANSKESARPPANSKESARPPANSRVCRTGLVFHADGACAAKERAQGRMRMRCTARECETALARGAFRARDTCKAQKPGTPRTATAA